MEQKKYTIGDKEVQLAPPTPARISQILKLSGFNNFSETIQSQDGRNKFACFLFDLQLDEAKLISLMNSCLVDGVEVNDWHNVDSRIIVGIVTDFFSQLQSMNPSS